MIHWLTQSTAAHPDLVQGLTSPAGLLTPAEEARFAALRTDKRRRDWLLGRWTAKRLLQSVLATKMGQPPALQSITIHNQLNGAPVARYHHPLDEPPPPLPDPAPSAGSGQALSADGCRPSVEGWFTLSISHAGDYAFCALVEQPDWPLGADIEQIMPRAAVFVSDYFTPAEQALLVQSPPEQYHMLVTAMWSAKEAALKALQLGLTVDTRAVSCLIAPVSEPPQVWTPFAIELNREMLAGKLPPHLAAPHLTALLHDQLRLEGWWQTMPGYVLTLAAAPTDEAGETGFF